MKATRDILGIYVLRYLLENKYKLSFYDFMQEVLLQFYPHMIKIFMFSYGFKNCFLSLMLP